MVKTVQHFGVLGTVVLACWALLPAESPTASRPASQQTSSPTTWPVEWVPGFQQAQDCRIAEVGRITGRIMQNEAILEQIKSRTYRYEPGVPAPVFKAKVEQEADSLRQQLRDLPLVWLPPFAPLKELRVGDIGPLRCGKINVIQVMGPTELRGQFVESEVWAIYGGTNRALEPRWQNPVWFRGLDTKGLADDTIIPLKGVFVISGTRVYHTASGARRTEYLIEPLDEAAWKLAFAAWAKSGSTSKPAGQ